MALSESTSLTFIDIHANLSSIIPLHSPFYMIKYKKAILNREVQRWNGQVGLVYLY